MTHHDHEIKDKLVEYVQDGVAMEKNVMRMLDSMINTTSDPEWVERLKHHREETERHAANLEGRLESLGGEVGSKLKEAPAILGALGKGMMDQARGDKPGRNARDGFVTEHLEIAAYELLERVATRAGDEETARVARENRADEESMAEFIASKWDKVIDLTLQEEGIKA